MGCGASKNLKPIKHHDDELVIESMESIPDLETTCADSTIVPIKVKNKKSPGRSTDTNELYMGKGRTKKSVTDDKNKDNSSKNMDVKKIDQSTKDQRRKITEKMTKTRDSNDKDKTTKDNKRKAKDSPRNDKASKNIKSSRNQTDKNKDMVVVENLEEYEEDSKTSHKLGSNSNNCTHLHFMKSRIPVPIAHRAHFLKLARMERRAYGTAFLLHKVNREKVVRPMATKARYGQARASTGNTDDGDSQQPSQESIIRELKDAGILADDNTTTGMVPTTELADVSTHVNGRLPPIDTNTSTDSLDPVGSSGSLDFSQETDDNSRVDVRFLRDIRVKAKQLESEKLKLKMLDLDIL